MLGGVCKSVRTSVSIQIAYAYVGNINNPQAEIQYISYDWSETTNVNLRVILTHFKTLKVRNNIFCCC